MKLLSYAALMILAYTIFTTLFDTNDTNINISDKMSSVKPHELDVGMNLESYQPDSDGINQAVPSVNIAKSARSFETITKALKTKNISYDVNGYPLEVKIGQRVESHMLFGLTKGSIPNGLYTVMFDGTGQLTFGGLFSLEQKINSNTYLININIAKESYNRGVIKIVTSKRGDNIRNLKVVMPGGICNDNIFEFSSKTECSGNYKSFVDSFKNEPNKIIFNPDYLNFVKDFKTLRVMNFHETSQKPGKMCIPRKINDRDIAKFKHLSSKQQDHHIKQLKQKLKNAAIKRCMTYKTSWKLRSKVSDYSWGSSYRIDSAYRKGAPWEVSIELANVLAINGYTPQLYYVLSFNIDDNYIHNLSLLLNRKLDKRLNIYLENNNEAWNYRFHGTLYVQYMGKRNNPEKDGNAYREGYKFYATDAVRVFNIFNRNFPRNRTNRVLGSFQWNPHLTEGILKYNDTYKHVDSVAIGTYFYMCYSSKNCKDSKGLDNLSRSSEIEKHLLADPKINRYGIPSLMQHIDRHYEYTNKYGVNLISYEGGLHITVQNLNDRHAEHYVGILNKFNDSLHTKKLYEIYLNELVSRKKLSMWIAFTSPQSYHKWGPFGIKQTLRGTSYKYEAVKSYTKSYNKEATLDLEYKSKPEFNSAIHMNTDSLFED